MKLWSISQEKQKLREKSEKLERILCNRNIFFFNYLLIPSIFLRARRVLAKTVLPSFPHKLSVLSTKGSPLEYCEKNRDCNKIWLNHFCCLRMNWNEGTSYVYGPCLFSVLEKYRHFFFVRGQYIEGKFKHFLYSYKLFKALKVTKS